MSQLNYRQIETALARREEFKGNSCHAVWEGDVYSVYSYSTRIFTVEGAYAGKPGTGTAELNTQKYSQTTSKLQNIIRRVYGIK
jgi:hypothetical protein